MKPLNLFYKEPDPDRWFKFDRYPRRIVRRLIRGKSRPGGVGMVAINLMKGLDRLNVKYRLNDFGYIRKNPKEIACIIGKPHVLLEGHWKNPIIFGAGVYSHPINCPELFSAFPTVKKVLVPGEWMRKMFEPYYGDNVLDWPVGIDTYRWSPVIKDKSSFDFLIYDKIRWEHPQFETELIDPICRYLDKMGLSYHFIRYGNYIPDDLMLKIRQSKAVIFLCEHETQGLAYQQILATDTPILAWDRGHYWKDPAYYPQIKYTPVTSVPYWDGRCGVKFLDVNDFGIQLERFLAQIGQFKPREFILENLTLELCAGRYLDIYHNVYQHISDEKI